MDAVVKDSLMYSAIVSQEPDMLKAVAHPLREEILRLTLEKPMYPVEIAKAMGVIEQKVYYHINILKEAGVLEEVEERQMRGGKAKLVAPRATAFGYIMSNARGGQLVEYSDYPPFVKGGVVDARIVVGSPDPHGENRARARDGHLAAEMASFFARMGTIPWPFIYTDTEVRDYSGNLIILGGPIVNTVARRFNTHMPVHFVERAIESPGKEYYEDWAGFVAVTDNPQDPGRRIMEVAGRTSAGTRAAILGLREQFKRIQENGYIVVQGFDEDGDGIVDSIDLLE